MSDMAREERTASFQRGEGFDMTVGRVLTYTLPMTGFTIVAHRFGVAWRGSVPIMSRNGVEALIGIIRRAVVHHEHLKTSYDSIEGQSYLSEAETDGRMLGYDNPSASILDVNGVVMTDP